MMMKYWTCKCNMAATVLPLVCLVVLMSGTAVAQQSGDEQILRYTLVEENDRGKEIANVATNAGLDVKYGAAALQNMQFSFLEQSSEHTDLFDIEAGTGILSAAQVVDRDEICPNMDLCVIPLDISVQPGQYFQIIKVEITVQDINDKAPTFPEGKISRSLLEASVPGASISIPVAEDPDSPPNSIKQYNLISNLDTFDLQKTDNPDDSVTLQLVLKVALDRETVEFYEAEIVAFDGGNPPKTGTLTVDIQVTDINDNSPTFDNGTYETFVYENVAQFTRIFQVHARDPDAGLNGEVVYGFTAKTKQDFGNIFSIDETTGEIFVISELDYERTPVYNLGVTAKDKNPDSLPAIAKVVIRVRDLNDHAPEITINSADENGRVQVSEYSVPGDFVAHITVIDPDGGRNGEFNCTISSPYFQLTQLFKTEFKIMTAVTFDREVIPEYDITLVCRDKGTPAQGSTKHVLVDIKDENDHNPVFYQEVYETSIKENNLKGAFIIRVNAMDQDTGDNADIEYQLVPDTRGWFAIGPQSGNITARERLDYEEVKTITIGVIAFDRGNPRRNATATVILNIRDVDDEAPKFSRKRYIMSVPENEPKGYRVGQVEAHDPDSGPHNSFIFTLDPRYNSSDTFIIEPHNGTIHTRRSLDRERRSEYHLVVTAVSLKPPQLRNSTNVFIYVGDVNDNAPRIEFPNIYNDTIYITQDLLKDHVLTRIRASDRDYGNNAELRYELVSGNTDGLFMVDEYIGVVMTVTEVKVTADSQYDLVIRVKDQGSPIRASETTLNIVVNRSAIHPHADASVMSAYNLKIVIAIASVSGVVMVILLIAIVMILRKQTRNDKEKKYNYMPRIVDQKIYMKQTSIDNSETPNGYLPNEGYTNMAMQGEGHLNDTFDKSSAFPDGDYPSLEKIPDSEDTVFTTTDSGPAVLYRPSKKHPLPEPWNLDPQHHRLIYQTDHVVHKPWVLSASQLQGAAVGPQNPGDKDSDSACSGDLSNATDSGRGSNDGGSDGLHDYRPTSPQWDNRQANARALDPGRPWQTPRKDRPHPPQRVSSMSTHPLEAGVHRIPSTSAYSDNMPIGHKHKKPQTPSRHAQHSDSWAHAKPSPRDRQGYYPNPRTATPSGSNKSLQFGGNGGGGKKYASHV